MKVLEQTKNIYIAFDGKKFDDKQKCLDYENLFTNLRQETIEKLIFHNKTIEDVLGVIVDDKYKITFENFLEITKDWFYDAYYGGDCPIESWKIVGQDWWLERWEYDGSSGWRLKEMPKLDKLEFNTITKIEFEKVMKGENK